MDLEVLIENVLNALAAGITIGCIYGLMCVGLGLIFGIMRVVNFAQGELLMLGMYVSLLSGQRLGRARRSSDPTSARSSARCSPARCCSSAARCCIDS